jgi:SAM-dependent MidA family methyltransferase
MSISEQNLREEIQQTIALRGPVTFAWFMEQALYHPVHGYYSSGRCTIGRDGDFYTSVSVGPVFGRLLAAQFAEIWAALRRPDDFLIVEQGAHDGAFARDVLEAAQRHHPEFFAASRYVIVEPFAVLQTRQAANLSVFREKVSWQQLLANLPPFRGVHFSNELLDAMPVHLMRWTGTEWLERHVTNADAGFAFVDLPPSTPVLTARLHALSVPFPAGYETEVNLVAREWVADISAKLKQGFILAVDYGFPRENFYGPQRTTGTLRSYAKHRVVASPLEDVGQVDITAHVEWTSVAEAAEASGLTTAGFADQHHFITGLLAGELAEEFGPTSDPKTRRALQTLLHPQFLGQDFQILALSKGLEPIPALSGFRFAREPRGKLGLHGISAGLAKSRRDALDQH